MVETKTCSEYFKNWPSIFQKKCKLLNAKKDNGKFSGIIEKKTTTILNIMVSFLNQQGKGNMEFLFSLYYCDLAK